MITVTLRNKTFQLTPNISLADALPILKIDTEMAAIAINNIFVPRSQYLDTLLQDGDQLEIVTPMQGG